MKRAHDDDTRMTKLKRAIPILTSIEHARKVVASFPEHLRAQIQALMDEQRPDLKGNTEE